MTKTIELAGNGLSDDAKNKFNRLGLRTETIERLDGLVREWSVKGKSVFSASIAARAKKVERLVAALRELDAALRDVTYLDQTAVSSVTTQDFSRRADELESSAAWMYASNGKAKGGRPSSADAARALVEEIASIVAEDLPAAVRPEIAVSMSESMRAILGGNFDEAQRAMKDAREVAIKNLTTIIEDVFICVSLDNGIGQATGSIEALQWFLEYRAIR